MYKPGQTVNIRAFLLDPELKPVTGPIVVEAQDAKGIKVFRKATSSDDYGMTTLELPLSTEPNLGVWKLTAFSGNRKTQLDIRVEEYVLPKYDVAVDLPKVLDSGQRANNGRRVVGVQLWQAGQGRSDHHSNALRRKVGGVRLDRRTTRRHDDVRITGARLRGRCSRRSRDWETSSFRSRCMNGTPDTLSRLRS